MKAKNVVVPIAAALTLLLAYGVYAPPARSSCAAPMLSVGGSGPYDSGGTIVIRGRYWTGECNDVVTCSVGCFGHQTCSGGGPPAPAQNIALVLRGRGVTAPLADGLGGLTFSVTATVPDVPPGRYRIVGTSADTGRWQSEPLRIG